VPPASSREAPRPSPGRLLEIGGHGRSSEDHRQCGTRPSRAAPRIWTPSSTTDWMGGPATATFTDTGVISRSEVTMVISVMITSRVTASDSSLEMGDMVRI
jgi:hypothetical protein